MTVVRSSVPNEQTMVFSDLFSGLRVLVGPLNTRYPIYGPCSWWHSIICWPLKINWCHRTLAGPTSVDWRVDNGWRPHYINCDGRRQTATMRGSGQMCFLCVRAAEPYPKYRMPEGKGDHTHTSPIHIHAKIVMTIITRTQLRIVYSAIQFYFFFFHARSLHIIFSSVACDNLSRPNKFNDEYQIWRWQRLSTCATRPHQWIRLGDGKVHGRKPFPCVFNLIRFGIFHFQLRNLCVAPHVHSIWTEAFYDFLNKFHFLFPLQCLSTIPLDALEFTWSVFQLCSVHSAYAVAQTLFAVFIILLGNAFIRVTSTVEQCDKHSCWRQQRKYNNKRKKT